MRIFRLLIVAGITVSLSAAWAGYRDYSNSSTPPFSENTGARGSRIQHQRVTPSPSVKESNVNDYTQMEDILSLDPESGKTVILRTDQKMGLNEYVPHLIPIQNMSESSVRELRPIARRICGMEGGYAQIVVDSASKRRYVQITCTPYQLPFVEKAIKALDKAWLNSTDSGSAQVVYKAHYRNVSNIDELVRKYTGGVSQIDRQDNAVVHENTPSHGRDYLGTARVVDVPIHEITVDARFYEINRNNDLMLGLDYIAWKNDVGWDLFTVGCSALNTPAYNFRSKNYGYHFYSSATYYDFLAVKGKARVLANATIQTVSGSLGQWSSIDPVAAISVTGPLKTGSRPSLTGTTFHRSAVISFIMENMGSYTTDGTWVPTYTYSFLNTATDDYLFTILRDDPSYIGSATQKDAFLQVLEAQNTSDGRINYSTDYGRYLDYESFDDVGLDLRVLPIVGIESTEMFVHAESGYVEGYTPTGAPQIAQSLVDTTVRVQDGEQLVLAGLSRSESVKHRAGMPFLADLPILGYLFGGETKFDREKDILIVLDTSISAGLVDPETRRPLSEDEVRRLKAASRFGAMQPASQAVPEKFQDVRRKATRQEYLDVPNTSFGFDQWLLDPAKVGAGEQ